MREYTELIKKILEKGIEIQDRTGVGTLRLVDDSTLTFNLQDGFPIVTGKRTFWKTAFAEFIWMLSGSTNINDLPDSAKKWWLPFDKNKNGDMGFNYGFQLRHANASKCKLSPSVWYDVETIGEELDWKDQLLATIYSIINTPYSRRHVMTMWNAVQMDFSTLPSCHGTVIQFFVNPDGTLDCKTYQRSCDIFIGGNHNIIQYALLTHIFADICNLKPGRLIYTFGDLHLYKNHIAGAKEYLTRSHFPLPKLIIKRPLTVNDLDVDNFKLSVNDFDLEGYQYHPAIKVEMAV